jgi:hypothetical protein
MTLSFGQWMKLGFGGLALLAKHRAASPAIRALVNDAIDLWESVVPKEQEPDSGMTHTEAIEKVRTGALTPAEQAQFDRASSGSSG